MDMETIALQTPSRCALIEITGQVGERVQTSGVKRGICLVYVPHTTAAGTINENADPAVKRDILMKLDRMVPLDDGYRHSEGNSAAHIKASLFGYSVLIPIEGGKLALGTWQGIFFCEFDGPRRRTVHCTVLRVV